MKKSVAMIHLLFFHLFALASNDSLSLKIEKYSTLIADEIEKTEKGENNKNYLFILNNNSIADSISISGNWMEEKGIESRRIFSSFEFNDLENSLQTFNESSPTGTKLYAVVINDLQVEFSYSAVNVDSMEAFELNSLSRQKLNEKKLIEYENTKKRINGELTRSILKKLVQRQIDTTHLVLYSYFKVRGYSVKNETTVREKIFYHDNIFLAPPIVPYREVISHLVKGSCQGNQSRPYYVIKALIDALNAYQTISLLDCNQNTDDRLSATAHLRYKYFQRDVDSIAGILRMPESIRTVKGFCENLTTAKLIFTAGFSNYMNLLPVEDRNFYKYEWADKISLLPGRSNYNLYTVFSPLTYFVSDDSMRVMVKQMHELAGMGTNDILIFSPYLVILCDTNILNSSASDYLSLNFPSVYVPDEELNTQLQAELYSAPDIHGKLRDVFRKIPKDHYTFYGFINYMNEAVLITEPQKEINVADNYDILDFYLFEDLRRKSYFELFIASGGFFSGIGNSILNLSNPLDEILESVKEQKDQYFGEHPEPEWQEVNHRLREKYISPTNCAEFTEAFIENEEGTIDDNWFKEGYNPFTQEYVLSVLDALSVVLAPVGLDIITDATAAVYCNWNGDFSNTTFYGAFIFIPFAGGGTAKTAKSIATGDAYIYKSIASNQISARKNLDDLYQHTLKEFPEDVQQQLALPVCRNVNGEVITRIMSHKDDPEFLAFSKHLEEILPDNQPLKILLRDNPEKIDDYFLNYFKTGRSLGEFLEIGNIVFNIDDVYPLLRTETNTAFFWSGRTNGIGGQERALEIALGKDGITLEGLLANNGINLPPFSGNQEIWEQVSAAYANQVSGEVRAVVGSQLRIGNVWENVELPRLIANENVSKITLIDPESLIETVIFTR